MFSYLQFRSFKSYLISNLIEFTKFTFRSEIQNAEQNGKLQLKHYLHIMNKTCNSLNTHNGTQKFIGVTICICTLHMSPTRWDLITRLQNRIRSQRIQKSSGLRDVSELSTPLLVHCSQPKVLNFLSITIL